MARRLSPLAALLLASAVVAGLPARAGADDKPINVVFTGKLDSETLDASGSGVLVLTGDIRPTAWLLADPQKFVVTPVAAEGVTYGKVMTTDPVDRRDPKLPDAPPVKVWTERVVVVVPFKLAENAKAPVDVGAELTWTACDESRCYDPEKTAKPIVASVRRAEAPAAPEPAPPPPAPPEEAPKDAPAPAPAMEPVPAPPPPPSSPPTPAATLGELKKEHNVDVGGGGLALRLTVPADVVGLAGSAVGVDVFFYDDQGRPIRSNHLALADPQGTLRVTSKTAQLDSDPAALDFVFLVPYVAFPARGAKYTVEARATISVRAMTKEQAKLLGTKSTTFQVE